VQETKKVTADVRRRQQQQRRRRRQVEERVSSAAQTAAWQDKHLSQPQTKWRQQSRRNAPGGQMNGQFWASRFVVAEACSGAKEPTG